MPVSVSVGKKARIGLIVTLIAWAVHVLNLNRPRRRRRPYSRSEVIHRAGDESFFPAFERERPRIVNNFAASGSSGYEWSCVSEKMN